MLCNLEVATELVAAVARTRELLNIAKENFDRAMRGDPSGQQQTDRAVNIRNAAAAHTYALRSHTQALQEHRDFVLDGLIPERFK